MHKTSIQPFSAVATIGMEYRYLSAPIEEKNVISFIQQYQEDLIAKKNIHLSCSISRCTIVLSGQVEPHLKLSFINYPKFPQEHSILKREIEALVESVMKRFQQNRVVIEYHDETVMLEHSSEIDPRIKL